MVECVVRVRQNSKAGGITRTQIVAILKEDIKFLVNN